MAEKVLTYFMDGPLEKSWKLLEKSANFEENEEKSEIVWKNLKLLRNVFLSCFNID